MKTSHEYPEVEFFHPVTISLTFEKVEELIAFRALVNWRTGSLAAADMVGAVSDKHGKCSAQDVHDVALCVYDELNKVW